MKIHHFFFFFFFLVKALNYCTVLTVIPIDMAFGHLFCQADKKWFLFLVHLNNEIFSLLKLCLCSLNYSNKKNQHGSWRKIAEEAGRFAIRKSEMQIFFIFTSKQQSHKTPLRSTSCYRNAFRSKASLAAALKL